jgi:hypothetical protein
MNKKAIAVLCALGLAFGALPILAQGAPGQAVKLKVTAEQANLREKPDIGSAVVQQIPGGTVLEADRKEGEWYLVRYTLEDGGVIAGYIHESLVSVEGQAPAAGAAVPAAGAAAAAAKPQAQPAGAGSDSWYEVFLPFDIRIAAGGSSLSADQFNNAARGIADYNGASLGLPSTGSIAPLHLTYLLTVDVSYRLSRWIALGLGLDFLKGWRESQILYATPEIMAVTPQTSTQPSVKGTPLRFSVYFYPRSDFFFRGSVVYYSLKAGYYYKFVPNEGAWQEWEGRGTAHTLGMEVAVGGDLSVGKNLFLFGEAGFRLAQASGFTGSGSYRDSAGASTTVDGDLWYFQALGADGQSHDLLFASAAEPSGDDILGARKASLNLSGTMLRLGLKIRF